MEHVYENVAGTLFRALREELIKRFQRELSTFADDLNDWLYHLLENPTPDWRRDLEVFLVEQAAQGRVVTEEHREELLAFLEAWWLRFMEGTPVVRRYSKKREEPDSDAFSIFAEVGATVIGIFVEPIDWVMTGLEIYNDYKSPYSYAGLIPGVPSSAGKAAKALLKLGDEGSGVAKVVAEVGEEVAEAASTAKKIPNPHGRLGGPEHRAKVAERARELEEEGHKIVGGGGVHREQAIQTPEGRRFPDISTKDAHGIPYYENVGRSKKDGTPIAREQRALEDIEASTGRKPGFTPYDRD